MHLSLYIEHLKSSKRLHLPQLNQRYVSNIDDMMGGIVH
jgi:hypothetical protein